MFGPHLYCLVKNAELTAKPTSWCRSCRLLFNLCLLVLFIILSGDGLGLLNLT